MKSPWWITPNKCTPYMVVSHLGSSDCQNWMNRSIFCANVLTSQPQTVLICFRFPELSRIQFIQSRKSRRANPIRRKWTGSVVSLYQNLLLALLWINFDLFLILRFGSIIEYAIMALPLCYNVCTYIKSN